MKNSPVNEIRYDESKSTLIIKTTSQEIQEELTKKLKRASYEAVRDRGLSKKFDVSTAGDAIYLMGNLDVALCHLSCHGYVDPSRFAELGAQMIWAKYGLNPLIHAPRPTKQASSPSPQAAREDAVVIHMPARTPKPGGGVSSSSA